MTIFCYKKLDATLCLAEKFRQARGERGWEVEDVVKKTRMPRKYVECIEAGRFAELPKAKPYRLAYIRQYAEILRLNVCECVEQFRREDGLDKTALAHPHRSMKIFPFASISLFARNGVIAIFALAFIGYLVWQVRGVLEPPLLKVYSPFEGYVASQPNTMVQGETEKETRLTVNGQDVMVNGQGKFEVKLDLSPGVNTIVITAAKKHGKATTVTRHLVVKPTPGLVNQLSLIKDSNNDSVGL